MTEVWKPVLDGWYEVSNLGTVRRLKPGRGTRVGWVQRIWLDNYGYQMVGPYIAGKRIRAKVHRLVAGAFIGPCPPGKEVNHKDGDKTNNRADNLEYLTKSENVLHSYRNGLRTPPVIYPQATIDEAKRLRKDGLAYRAISERTGMSRTYCRDVCIGTWRAG